MMLWNRGAAAEGNQPTNIKHQAGHGRELEPSDIVTAVGDIMFVFRLHVATSIFTLFSRKASQKGPSQTCVVRDGSMVEMSARKTIYVAN